MTPHGLAHVEAAKADGLLVDRRKELAHAARRRNGNPQWQCSRETANFLRARLAAERRRVLS